METEKFVINVTSTDGQPVEVIIREGDAPKLLPVLEPVKVELVGVIDTPVEFLTRRLKQEQFKIENCHVKVNRKDISIELVINESDARFKGSVKGILTQHPKFTEFGINTGKRWETIELGKFFKMNRAFFANIEDNRRLVTLLKSFEATIETKLEKEKTEKGNSKDNRTVVVTNSLPDNFFLSVPLFKGAGAIPLEVEFDATVNGSEITLQLYSPAAEQALQDNLDVILNAEIAKIRELAPDMVIYEV